MLNLNILIPAIRRGNNMLNGNNIIEINDESIISSEEIIHGLKNRKNKFFEIFRNRDIYLIIKDKEIYIKLINFPKVKSNQLAKLIENELKYYMNFTNEMLYSYCIYKEYRNSIDVLVYCIHFNKLYVIDSLANNKLVVKKINPIQVIYVNYFNKGINVDNYILIFQNENKIYFLACLNKKLICNYVCNAEITYIDFQRKLEKLINKAENFEKTSVFNEIYFLDFKNKEMINLVSQQYLCNDLGYVNKVNILRYIMKGTD